YFWIITETGAQEALVKDLSWLPDYRDLLLVVTHRKHRRTVMYQNRHKVEFGVFDRNEAREGKGRSNVIEYCLIATTSQNSLRPFINKRSMKPGQSRMLSRISAYCYGQRASDTVEASCCGP